MIKGEELRKGNKVIASFQSVTVKETYEKSALVEFPSGKSEIYDFVSLKPIRLTTEMLTSELHFGKKGDTDSIWYLRDFYIEENENGGFRRVFGTDEPFYYLHELQNIYYVLFDRELTETL